MQNMIVLDIHLMILRKKARVLKAGCFLVEVLPAENENNYEYLYQIKQYAKEAGFVYYSKVSWKKRNLCE